MTARARAIIRHAERRLVGVAMALTALVLEQIVLRSVAGKDKSPGPSRKRT